MTDAKMKELYTLACDTKGFELNPGQLKVWKQTMGIFDAADMEAAIREWYGSNNTFPMPAELKPLIESARRKRTAPTTGYEFTTAYRCPRCGATCCGFTPAHEQRCERCWKGGYLGRDNPPSTYSLMSVELQERKKRGDEKAEWENIMPQPANMQNPLPDYIRRARGMYEE